MPTELPDQVGRRLHALDSNHCYPMTRVVEISDICGDWYGRRVRMCYFLECLRWDPNLDSVIRAGFTIMPLVNTHPTVMITDGLNYAGCRLRDLNHRVTDIIVRLALRPRDELDLIDGERLRRLVLKYNPFPLDTPATRVAS